MNDENKPVCVYRAGNLQEAHLVLDLLLKAGVSARIASNSVETIAGEVPFQLVACPIWAPVGEAERAAEVISQHRKKAKQMAELPFCYHCGAAMAIRQDACHECETPLDWSP